MAAGNLDGEMGRAVDVADWEEAATSCCGRGATGSGGTGAVVEDTSLVFAMTALLTTSAIASSAPEAVAEGSEDVRTMYSEMRPSTL